MATLKNLTVDDTGFLQLPSGTTAQRPVAPTAGMMRYNTDFGTTELYNGSLWIDPATDKPVVGSIVTSDLLLHYDFGDRLSYFPMRNIVFDLCGKNSHGTLFNGVSWNSNNGGYAIFDGVDDYADFKVNGVGNTITVEMWIKLGATYGANKMFFGWNLYDVYTNLDTIGYNTGNGDIYGISAATASSLGVAGNWKQFVFLMRSDVSYTNNKIWVNAASQTLSQQLGTESASNRSFNNGLGRIASWRTSNEYRMNMDLAIFRIYNKGLSDSEVIQNFNATKGRFGI